MVREPTIVVEPSEPAAGRSITVTLTHYAGRDGVPTDADFTGGVVAPDGTASDASVDQLDVGTYRLVFTPDAAGEWRWRFLKARPPAARFSGAVIVA